MKINKYQKIIVSFTSAALAAASLPFIWKWSIAPFFNVEPITWQTVVIMSIVLEIFDYAKHSDCQEMSIEQSSKFCGEQIVGLILRTLLFTGLAYIIYAITH